MPKKNTPSVPCPDCGTLIHTRSARCFPCSLKAKRASGRYSVDPITGCWIIPIKPMPEGYVRISVDGRRVMAHVHYYEQKYGPVPEGKQLDHVVCDNRRCCNPDHVRPATNAENSRRKPNIILDVDSVREIKSLFGKMTGLELAARYGVSPVTISAIKVGRIWGDV